MKRLNDLIKIESRLASYLMKDILTIVFIFFALSALSQPRSPKRGLGYGDNSPQDLLALSKGISWYYNWYHQPEASVINVYQNYNIDYVPMAWNGAFNKQAMHDFLSTHPGVKYILGFNEPNFVDQAKLTPSQAAALWPDIEAVADEFELEIVSPAVNYCDNCVSENGTTYTDPVKYLDDFFAACKNCRVDHIAIHCYMENVSALQWYVGQFKKYGKPIWLTEFAAWEGQPTLQEQKKFMIDAVGYLETDPDVFRYAWFTGRFDNKSPFIGLLQQPGVLTTLGDIYVNLPAGVVLDVENQNTNKITLFPNPTSGPINIEAGSEWVKFEVMDMMGASCLQGDLRSLIDLDALGVGPYLIKLIDNNGDQIFRKVIKK